jgi:hypothetical protein
VGAFGEVRAVREAIRESRSGGSCSRGNWARSYVIYHQWYPGAESGPGEGGMGSSGPTLALKV